LASAVAEVATPSENTITAPSTLLGFIVLFSFG
jgi:hypothetical protein